eukprot:TRINITY_DN4499_c0_g3_i1.p1 TRINITY_DN4499_c0_g3~~TRINITY_DN4499_c0_g3_i1.p1  ORF type:complete len:226 (+),score=47.25 TRINITY_DN4499_c0_g3_i1:61-678(+)
MAFAEHQRTRKHSSGRFLLSTVGFLVLLGLAASSLNALISGARIAFIGSSRFYHEHRSVNLHRHAGLGDLMGALPKAMEAAKKLPELQQKLRETPSTGSALGGKVEVTLTGDLAPVSVKIDQSVLDEGLPAQVVSDAVFMAMKQAHNTSVEMTKSELAEFYKGMGVPQPGGAAPAPAPAPAAPKENLDFDPLGIGRSGGPTRSVD